MIFKNNKSKKKNKFKKNKKGGAFGGGAPGGTDCTPIVGFLALPPEGQEAHIQSLNKDERRNFFSLLAECDDLGAVPSDDLLNAFIPDNADINFFLDIVKTKLEDRTRACNELDDAIVNKLIEIGIMCNYLNQIIEGIIMISDITNDRIRALIYLLLHIITNPDRPELEDLKREQAKLIEILNNYQEFFANPAGINLLTEQLGMDEDEIRRGFDFTGDLDRLLMDWRVGPGDAVDAGSGESSMNDLDARLEALRRSE